MFVISARTGVSVIVRLNGLAYQQPNGPW